MQEPLPEHPAAPVRPSERIDAIDMLRGIALFIVLAVNAATEFRVSIFEQFLPDASAPSLDSFWGAVILALHSKGLILFSFLFGVGLAIQFDRLAGNERRLILLLRRLAVLMAFGLFHLFLIWNGDILTEYAIAGFVALPFLFGSRALLATTAALALAWFVASPFLPSLLPLPGRAWMIHHVEEARQVYGAGGFAEILAFRIDEVRAIAPLHVYVLPRTLGLFLLGAWVWRTGFFGRALSGPLPFAAAMLAVAIGAVLTVAAEAGKFLDWRRDLLALSVAQLLLATGYGTAIAAAAHRAWGRRIFGWAIPLGRMAFTNYIVQSIVLGWIFYGYGLGLFGHASVAQSLAIAVVLYAVQAVLSQWWLARFRFGPLEWLWRSLMYGRRQLNRRAG